MKDEKSRGGDQDRESETERQREREMKDEKSRR